MEKALTKYFWVFNLVTLLLIALFLASGTGDYVVSKVLARFPSHVVDGPGTKSPRRTTRSGIPSRFRKPSGKIILERNIFDSTAPALDQFDIDTDNTVTLAKGEVPLVPCEMSGVKLLATVASVQHPDWSFVTIQDGKETKLYRIGDQISNREVSDISWRYLFLLGTSDECYMDLFGDKKKIKRPRKKKSGPADFASGIEVVSEFERNVDRSLIDKALADPTQFAKSVRIRPYKRNGKTQGFKIRRVGKDSPLSLLGAKNGDIIKAVNGEKLNSVTQALGLYQKLGTESRLTFELERRGKPVEMVVNIR